MESGSTVPVGSVLSGKPLSHPIEVTMGDANNGNGGSGGGGGGSIDGYGLMLLGWLLGFRLLRRRVRI